MRMRGGIYRVLRVLLVAAVAWLAFRWLRPQGLGWVVLAVPVTVVLGWVGLRALRIRRARAEDERADRWALALVRPPERPAAVRELREARDAARDEPERARLTLVLAEILEADGEPGAALEALATIRDSELGDTLSAVVRHARAVASLSAGDPAGAKDALDEDPSPCGHHAIDLRIRMLRGMIAAESGDAAEALEIAKRAKDEARGDEDLMTEARLLEAVALDAAGRSADAAKRMARLDDDMLDVLVVLGLPRVRALAAAVIEEREE